MYRVVLSGIAVVVVCLLSLIAWERLMRTPFYKLYYRLSDYSEPVDYSSDYGGAYADTRGGTYFDDITKRQSPDVQNVIKPLIAFLRSKSYDDLIILKSDPTPCELSDLIDCKGIDETIIKQYIEAAFAYRQFLETTDLTRSYNRIAAAVAAISLGSLVVSIIALLYSRRRLTV
jgi:hypothetical protein